LKLLVLLKNVKNSVFKYLEKSSKGIADAEDRFVASMFKQRDEDESNKG
jgi:hypothetical protein